MQPISSVDESLLLNYAPVKIGITIENQSEGLRSGNVQIDSMCGSADAFLFGNAGTSTLRMTLDGAFPNLRGKLVVLTWSVSDDQDYPLFRGWVTKSEVNSNKTTIQAGDTMLVQGSKPMMITERMRDHMTAGEGWVAVASQLDCHYVQEDADILDKIGILNGFSGLPEEVSISAVAGYLAGLIGANAVVDRSGVLRLTGPSAVSQSAVPFQGYSGGNTIQDQTFVVSGITMERTDLVQVRGDDGTVSEEEQISTYSAGDGTLLVTNPLCDQITTDLAWDNLQGLRFQPGRYSFPQGIQVELGDLVRVHTLEGYQTTAAMSVTHIIDGGVKTTTACGGWPEDGGTAGQINQALQSLAAEFARVRKLIAENAEIVNARISNLRAEDIIAGRIQSEDFSVTEDPLIYPGDALSPADSAFPKNGELIIKGFEIDFSAQIIRGSFTSDVTDSLDRRLTAVEQFIASLG